MLIFYGHIPEETCLFAALSEQNYKHTFLLKLQRTISLRHLIPALII